MSLAVIFIEATPGLATVRPSVIHFPMKTLRRSYSGPRSGLPTTRPAATSLTSCFFLSPPMTASPFHARAIAARVSSSGRLGVHLRRLLADPRRIDDELERIGVLMFFHQLQIREPLGACESLAVGKPGFRVFDQSRGHLVLPV